MDKLPFGKFIVSAGVGMAVAVAFVLYGAQRLEDSMGFRVMPYLFFVLLAILVIVVGIFNDSYKARITVPIGIGGWLMVLLMLFIHYSQQ